MRNFLFDSALCVTLLPPPPRALSSTWISFRLRCQTWRDGWCVSSAEPWRTAASPPLQRRSVTPARRCSCRWRSSALICSVFQLLKMFMFILDRPLIQDGLRPLPTRLLEMVLEELDQTELLFYSQRGNSETFSRFSPTAAARLCWTQLALRAADAVNSYGTVQHL